MNMEIVIRNIRNIRNAEVSLPLDQGIYSLVGENGCGKSTFMLIMSLIVKTSSAHMLTVEDLDESSSISITTEDGTDNWYYPNYAIRSLYVPNGFDFIILVEDELAKAIVEKVIRTNNLSQSKLCCVLPAGGCTQMLKLHFDMVTYNTLGAGKRIISVYDGDVKDEVSRKKEYSNLPKCFLPIPSVEKYLKRKLVDEPDREFIKTIGDKYFTQRSLQDIINDYRNNPRTKSGNDNNGKILYSIIIANLVKAGIQESLFIRCIADDIYVYENPTSFVASLRKLLL